MKKSDSARWKRDERQRMRDAGYVLLQVWVLPKFRERVVNYVRRLIRQESKK
ncbi:MAG: hypothetical protein ACLQKH_15130 [Steroidobacteraceae bacterium]